MLNQKDTAKSFVMAMLYNEGPIPIATLNAWVKPDSVRLEPFMKKETLDGST